jgi:hypothetical protein
VAPQAPLVLIGGRVSVASGSSAVAGRFRELELELARADGAALVGVKAICVTDFSSSPSASRGPFLEEWRVATARWVSSAAAGERLSRVRRSIDGRGSGRTAWAIVVLEVSRGSQSHL